MKKTFIMAFAIATLGISSCGNKTEATAENDSTAVVDSSVADVPEEVKSTVDNLFANINTCIEKKDAESLKTTLADMQVIYKNLVESGKLDEAKAYGQAIKDFINSHANDLKSFSEGNTTISSLVNGIVNLPTSASATIDEAKSAVVSDVVNFASPAVAKGETIVDAVKGAPESIKNAAETAAENAVDAAKAKANEKVEEAKAEAKEKVETEKEKAKEKAADKANKALDKARDGINNLLNK